MEDDTFNSSDIEMGPPPPSRWAHLGKQSIESIVANATADRLSSKNVSQHLENVTGAPGTIKLRNRWLNLFESFCKETLKHRSVLGVKRLTR